MRACARRCCDLYVRFWVILPGLGPFSLQLFGSVLGWIWFLFTSHIQWFHGPLVRLVPFPWFWSPWFYGPLVILSAMAVVLWSSGPVVLWFPGVRWSLLSDHHAYAYRGTLLLCFCRACLSRRAACRRRVQEDGGAHVFLKW